MTDHTDTHPANAGHIGRAYGDHKTMTGQQVGTGWAKTMHPDLGNELTRRWNTFEPMQAEIERLTAVLQAIYDKGRDGDCTVEFMAHYATHQARRALKASAKALASAERTK